MTIITLPRSYLDLQARGALDYWGGRTYGELSREERGRIVRERHCLGLCFEAAKKMG